VLLLPWLFAVVVVVVPVDMNLWVGLLVVRVLVLSYVGHNSA